MSWINCLDSIPPTGCETYLCCNKYGCVFMADRDMVDGEWVWVNGDGVEIGRTYGWPVTHWMPIPTPPILEAAE